MNKKNGYQVNPKMGEELHKIGKEKGSNKKKKKIQPYKGNSRQRRERKTKKD